MLISVSKHIHRFNLYIYIDYKNMSKGRDHNINEKKQGLSKIIYKLMILL